MGAKYQNFSNGISLEAKASAENISKGDLEVTFADGKLNYHNGTSSSPIVTESHTATLTNKTLTSPVINSGTLTTPILGTPVSGNLQNCTLPLSTLTDLNSNVKTFLITPSSANLAAAVIGTTGSGDLVFSNSPSLTTPNVGVATATSINKLSITAPASSATLTIADGKTLTASNTLTFTGTDSSSVAFSAGGTVAYVADKLSVFASTTSAELAGVISNETGFNAGTGNLVFSNQPVLTTPQINAINVNGTYTVTLPTSSPISGAALYYNGTNYNWEQVLNNNRSLAMVNAVVSTAVGAITPSVYGCAVPTATSTNGGGSAVLPTCTSYYTSKKIIEYLHTVSSSSAVAGWRWATESNIIGTTAYGGFRFSTGFGFADGFGAGQNGSTKVFFVGMTSSTVSPPAVSEPSSFWSNILGFGLDSTDSNINFMHSLGSAGATKIDLGANFSRPTANKQNFYNVDIIANDGSVYYKIKNMTNGAIAQGTVTTNIPSNSEYLSPRGYIGVGSTGSTTVGFAMEYITLETLL